MSTQVIEPIINVRVKLSQGNTVATVEWTSGQSGPFGYLYYAQGTPNQSLTYTLISTGPTSFAQNRFSVQVTGLNPALPYSFYVATVAVNGVPLFDNEGDPITDNEGNQLYSGNTQSIVAEMTTADYLLNPLSLRGVVPISGGFPIQGPIQLGADVAIDLAQGTIPNMADVLDDWYQALVFEKVGKMVSGGSAFQVIETTVQVPFRGLIVPEKSWELTLKPVAQRTWKFYKCYAETVLPLFTDDVVLWQGGQYRVVSMTDYSLFGYYEYSLAQDWVARGPIA
jgi:hypothetical protein